MDIFSLILCIILALPVSMRFKISLSRALVVIMGLVISFGYIGGILGHIYLGILLLIGVLLIDLIYCLFKYKSDVLKDKCDSGIIFLIIILAVTMIYHKHSVINNWDDWSHWAVQVKNIFYTGKFPCAEGNSISMYLDYLPGIQIWEAFWMKTGIFSDARLYVAWNMTIYIIFAGMISSANNKLKGGLLTVILVYTCNLFIPGTLSKSITMDLYMSVLLGYGLWMIYLNNYKMVELLMVIAMLSLSKQVGCLFALILLAILFFKLLFEWKKMSSKNKHLLLKRFIAYSCTEAAVIATWTMVKSINNVSNTGGSVYKEILESGLFSYLNTLEEWHLVGFKNFWLGLFNHKIVETNFCVVFYVTPWIKVPVIVYIVAIIILIAVLTRKKRDAWIPNILIFLAGLAYLLFLSSLYLFNFSEGEVNILSSYSRYIGTYLMAVFVLAMGLMYASDSDEGVWLNISAKSLRNMQIILLVIFIIIPNNNVNNFYYGLLSMQERNIKKEGFDELNKKILQAKDIQKLVDINSDIIIDNADIVTVSEWNYLLYPASVRLWGSIDGIWDSDDYIILTSKYRELSDLKKYAMYFDQSPIDGGIYRILRTDETYKMELVGNIKTK